MIKKEKSEVEQVGKIKCYMYTRVSTTLQIDNFSIPAQREKILDYAAYEKMEVVKEYSDAGYSGKNINGRPQFAQMLEDIQERKDGIKFVLVFKLSRFGRNAADVLSTVQLMQDYGVNLICVDDKIDSSLDSGKLLISILSSVAEIERENIRAQTMAGREQKAREGKWNGGFAPYGYQLIDGCLFPAEPEAEQVKLMYEKFANTTMGAGAVAEWLELNGYKKVARKNARSTTFNPGFIKGILDNPVYCGCIAYGRRKTEKIEGKRNEFHIVKQKEYPIYDGIHEALVSKDLWYAVQEKRERTGLKFIKKHSLEHEHLLSGILKCPVCGTSMYGNVNRKKNRNRSTNETTEYYQDYFYYHCKHRIRVDGIPCAYKRQWAEYKIDFAVEEIIRQLITNPRFEEAIKKKIDEQIDTSALEVELSNIKKKIKNIDNAIKKLSEEIDLLDYEDALYERKYQDMQNRLSSLYDQIQLYEEKRVASEQRILTIREEKIKSEKVYEFLMYFDKLYEKFTDLEKKTFLKTFVESVEIFPEEQADGRILKSIKFNFPVFYNGKEINGMSWDNEGRVETIALLQNTNM